MDSTCVPKAQVSLLADGTLLGRVGNRRPVMGPGVSHDLHTSWGRRMSTDGQMKRLLKDFGVRQNTSSVHHRDMELVLGIHPSRGEFTQTWRGGGRDRGF